MTTLDQSTLFEDLTFLDDTRVGAVDAAKRTGFSSAEALEKWLTRHGHFELWKRLARRDPAGIHTTKARQARRDKAKAAEERRTCSSCETEKPIDDYYVQSNGPGGRMSQCIKCNNDRPPTEARIVRQRARSRATMQLIEVHRDEFTRLIEAETVKARAEHAALTAAAEAAGNHDAAVARLRPGPRRAGEDSADRLDVARCRSCHTHHDADHECPSCGDVTPVEAPKVKPWMVREWARQNGLEVPIRGPIPVTVRAAYDQAQDHGHQEAS